MLTYQDYLKAEDKVQFIDGFISTHVHSEDYETAVTADLYDKQRNKTINEFVKTIYNLSGVPQEDYVASNHKIASNIFHRLNTQRCSYSLGNGVSFTDHRREVVNEDGTKSTIDETKEHLNASGFDFDYSFKKLAYKSLIHGVSFGYWNTKRLYVFPLTEFAPMWDEKDGSLAAGVRFWRLDDSKPLYAVLYEKDGYTKFHTNDRGRLVQDGQKHGYILQTQRSPADGEEVVGETNYSSLPVIPMWGSDLRQSTLIGIQQAIDSIDLIRSGFANDLNDCAEIYWLLENYDGMTDDDLMRFRDRIKFMHIAEVKTEDGGHVSAQTQDLPYVARQTFIESMKAQIYEDFGALDVHTVSAGATNDHIDAAYQPMDENADDFEYQCIEFLQRLLSLEGIKDTPVFKRNRLSNQKEQTEMVLSAANYLDDETILQKLPFISVDEVPNIMVRRYNEGMQRMTGGDSDTDEDNDDEVDDTETARGASR